MEKDSTAGESPLESRGQRRVTDPKRVSRMRLHNTKFGSTLVRACHLQYRRSAVQSVAAFEFYLLEVLPRDWEWTGWRYMDEKHGICCEVVFDLKEEVEIASLQEVFGIPEDSGCRISLIDQIAYGIDAVSFLVGRLSANAIRFDERSDVQCFGTLCAVDGTCHFAAYYAYV
jgi:hypothetical protein